MLDDLRHYLPLLTLAEWSIYFGGGISTLTDLEDAVEAEREAAGCPIPAWCYGLLPVRQSPKRGVRRKRVRWRSAA